MGALDRRINLVDGLIDASDMDGVPDFAPLIVEPSDSGRQPLACANDRANPETLELLET